MKEQPKEARRLTRHETHDLSMIIKDRTKVLKRHAEEQAAACMADFEKKLSTIYTYDQDEVWKRATEEAMAVVAKAQETIEARCKKMGIPKDLAPQLQLDASLHKICGLCGVKVNSSDQANEILQGMDTDSKTCPHCCRTYGEARREEGIT